MSGHRGFGCKKRMVRIARPGQTAPIMTKTMIVEKIDALPWDDLRAGIDTEGWVATGPLLSAAECDRLIALYDREDGFRGRVVMARHGLMPVGIPPDGKTTGKDCLATNLGEVADAGDMFR